MNSSASRVHGSQPVVLSIVAPSEGDVAVGDVGDAVVGDGDSVGIAAEVVEGLLGSTEGRLGVDDPLGVSGSLEVSLEALGLAEVSKIAVEDELSSAIGPFEGLEKAAAEEAREHPYRQKEPRSASDPPLTGGVESPAGDDAVQVWMKGERLSPGVEHGEEADLGPEVFGIGSDRA